MKTLTGFLSVLALASVTLAASLPKNEMRGTYVEARTADVYTGPCFANAESQLVGELAVMGWKIEQGAWDGVKLDGLGVVGALRAKSTLGDRFHPFFPVKAVLIVDEKANPEQRLALKSFAQHMSNDLLQDVVRVEYAPISLTFENNNLHSGAATLTAGKLANIQTRAINNHDHLCTNEEVWYDPLVTVEHAMPAFTLASGFRGEGLGTVWSSPDKRSAFVASFHYND